MIPQELWKVIKAVRPAIQQDGGDIIIHNFYPKTGVLKIELIGNCTDCSLAGLTLSEGLQKIFSERTSVKTVINIGEVNLLSTWAPDFFPKKN